MIGVMGRGVSIDSITGSSIVNYSNSQLKNHSVWMIVNNTIPEIQVEKIIGELGEFSDKEGPLKMYARRGQCFTTTKLITKLDESELREIKDITMPKTDDLYDINGTYIFTDGCGNISRALCDKINEKFDLLQCSAYQVRLGGAKGVLILKDSLGDDQRIVELRPSQLKFKSSDHFLEIIRCATYSQGYLNRQVILLLSNLGVDDDVFEEHLRTSLNSLKIEAVLKNLAKIYEKSKKSSSSRKQLAVEMDLFFGPSKIFGAIFKLSMIKTFEDKQLEREERKKIEERNAIELSSSNASQENQQLLSEIDQLEQKRDQGFNSSPSKMKQISGQASIGELKQSNKQPHQSSGSHLSLSDIGQGSVSHFSGKHFFDMTKEPIFNSILQNMVLGNAVNIKKKARIKIKDSAVLIGICDERGILKDGEVWICICRQSYENENEVVQTLEELQLGNKKADRKEKNRLQELLGLNIREAEQHVSGQVMVTKNPCSYPGDIRLLQAIDESDGRFQTDDEKGQDNLNYLKSLVNVVVFPVTGNRPEQHKMSGGDLDGDVYFAIWDKLIMHQLTPGMIREPATYAKFDDKTKIESNRIEDHISRYFEKDNLGSLCNMHMNLCDQLGEKWHEDPDTKELSRLISIAVDFAKHGKCVDYDNYRRIEQRITQVPDFMEQTDRKPIKTSEHILGKLYRSVDCKFYYKMCVEADHRQSINLEYPINSYILTKDQQSLKVIKENQGARVRGAGYLEEPRWHSYLQQAYKEIVVPMNEDIKKLMTQYKILNEGELFCTNLIYNLDNDKISKLIGDPGQKDEDAVKALNVKIKEIQDKYTNLKEEMNQKRSIRAIDFAKAIYFTSYYNNENQEFGDYVLKFGFESTSFIQSFHQKWLQIKIDSGYDEEFKIKYLGNFNTYKETLKKGKMESDSKISKILLHKQFFSVPWLVCFREYLIN